MSHDLRSRRPLLASLTLIAVMALPVSTVTAADTETAKDVVEEIVVTGSRVKRSDYSSASPITVIDGQSILESGFSNLNNFNPVISLSVFCA